nr:MAG TPA: hypothetical protein [Caudoviricetes sp.]
MGSGKNPSRPLEDKGKGHWKRWPFSSFPQFPLRVPYNQGSV